MFYLIYIKLMSIVSWDWDWNIEKIVYINPIYKNKFFDIQEEIIDVLIPSIWDYSEKDIEEAQKIVLEFYNDSWTWNYFNIVLDWKNIWLTWFYEIDPTNWIFWLRHHGILKQYRNKWIWIYVLQLVLREIEKKYDKVVWIVEMVPKWNNFIDTIFTKMWFVEVDENIRRIKKIEDQLKDWYYWKAVILKMNN